MQFSPIIIRKHQLNQTQALFLQHLRAKTREPYFDNKNSRRLDVTDTIGTIYADEYDRMISLRNEVINKNGIVFKTIILFKEKSKNKYFWTISYPGHYATVFLITACFGVFSGIYFLIENNSYGILSMGILMYVLLIPLSKDDYKSHFDLLKACNQ